MRFYGHSHPGTVGLLRDPLGGRRPQRCGERGHKNSTTRWSSSRYYWSGNFSSSFSVSLPFSSFSTFFFFISSLSRNLEVVPDSRVMVSEVYPSSTRFVSVVSVLRFSDFSSDEVVEGVGYGHWSHGKERGRSWRTGQWRLM